MASFTENNISERLLNVNPNFGLATPFFETSEKVQKSLKSGESIIIFKSSLSKKLTKDL